MRDYPDRVVVAGLLHYERRKDVRLQKILIRLTGNFLNDHTEQKVAGVAIRVFLARREIQFLLFEPLDHGRSRGRQDGRLGKVAKGRVIGYPRGMS